MDGGSGRLGPGAALVPYDRYRLSLGEPRTGGERLIEPARSQPLAELGHQFGLHPPQVRPGWQADPQDTEAAVYFCTLEALQNITKYAGASRAVVCLSCSDGSLRFTVTDDGAGFDTAGTRNGTGLQGMADRLAALGGALHVRSQSGHGTTLTGQLPVG